MMVTVVFKILLCLTLCLTLLDVFDPAPIVLDTGMCLSFSFSMLNNIYSQRWHNEEEIQKEAK